MFTKEKSKADNRSDVYLHDFPTDLWKQIKVSAVLKGVTVVDRRGGRSLSLLCRSPVSKEEVMTLPSLDGTYRRVLKNPKNSLRLRLDALKNMSRPSIRLLAKLESDQETPDQLRFAAAQRRAVETTIRGSAARPRADRGKVS